MKNADKIGNVAKQMIGVCNVIINLTEAEENEVYDEMLWDELSHTQKLVLEFTRYAFETEDGSEEVQISEEIHLEDSAEEAVEEEAKESPIEALFGEMNEDEAFFAGELESKKGDKTDDNLYVAIEDEEEEEEEP